MAELGRWRAAVVALASLLVAPRLAAPQPAAAPAQGKIIALHGRVEHAPASAQDAWTGAQAFQSLFVSDRVRTLTASRAAILFVDETQVKLNAQAILTVRAVRQPAGAPTAFELLRGEGWFRTKNPRAGVTINTPAAAAAIRGTEINLRVADDDTTTLTVVEGSVEFSNPLGAIIVDAGEEATARPGQAPTKRVILNPENAVQWALYYPTAIAPQDLPAAADASPAAPGLARLRANDAAGALALFEPTLQSSAWSRLGSSIAHLDRGDPERARAAIEADLSAPSAPAELTAALRAQAAAIALAIGDVEAAQRHFDAALAADAGSIPALALSSSFALIRNETDRALALAAKALATRADSIGGRLAAAEAAQAAFDLDAAREHLDAVLRDDPDQLRALVNRARIRFGIGDTRGAAADAARAARVRPDEGSVRSLLGFIKLGDGDTRGAEDDFTTAVRVDPELAEPHLGLGLLHFRNGRENDGLLEMLTATLLEPHVSLYQSYLGKAYYESRRFAEGLSALATAKRLDPRDPTPWLYSSFFLRDQYRPVAALRELNEAIARNDHRAVYRSRLLLDRDLATKNISLAEVYRQLGILDWAAFEALQSVQTDFTNSSARLFLANAYVGLSDRAQAASGELLNHFLYAPVNLNSFNNFAEYTSLFERAGAQHTLSATAASSAFTLGKLESRGGNQRAAYSALLEGIRAQDLRSDRDHRLTGIVSGKVAMGSATDVYVNVFQRSETLSQDVLGADIFGRDTARPFVLTLYERTRDRNITITRDSRTANIGLKHLWRPGTALTLNASAADSDRLNEDVDSPSFSCLGFPTELDGGRTLKQQTERDRAASVQLQQVSRIGPHQLSVGVDWYRLNKDRSCREQLFLRSAPVLVDDFTETSNGRDHFQVFYVQDEFQVTPWLHLAAGARFQDVTYDDPDELYEPFTIRRVDPLVGAAVRVTPRTVIRAAAFRNVNPGLFAQRLAPTTVAGFPIAQNEYTTAMRHEANVAVEHDWRRLFASAHVFARKRALPEEFNGQRFLPDAHARIIGTRGAANWIVSDRVAVNGNLTLTHSHTFAFDRRDGEAAGGVTFVHERRLSASVAGIFWWQRFSTTVPDLEDSSHLTIDASVTYDFPRKRGGVFVTINNALNRDVLPLVDLFSLPRVAPGRAYGAGVSWQF